MRRLSRLTLLHLIVLLLLPVGAAGQSGGATLHTGDEVQVSSPSLPSGRVRGRVLLYQGETLQLRETRSGDVVSVPVATIEALARNEGTDRGRSSWWMARLGGFVGGAGGLVAGPLIATTRAPGKFGEVMLASGVIGTAAGAGLGAVLGAAFARDHWQRFRMPIVPTGSADPGAIRIGFTVRVPS